MENYKKIHWWQYLGLAGCIIPGWEPLLSPSSLSIISRSRSVASNGCLLLLGCFCLLSPATTVWISSKDQLACLINWTMKSFFNNVLSGSVWWDRCGTKFLMQATILMNDCSYFLSCACSWICFFVFLDFIQSVFMQSNHSLVNAVVSADWAIWTFLRHCALLWALSNPQCLGVSKNLDAFSDDCTLPWRMKPFHSVTPASYGSVEGLFSIMHSRVFPGFSKDHQIIMNANYSWPLLHDDVCQSEPCSTTKLWVP